MTSHVERSVESVLSNEAVLDILSAEHDTIRTGAISVEAFPTWYIANIEWGHKDDKIDLIDTTYLTTLAQNIVPPLELGYPGSMDPVKDDEVRLARRVVILVGLEKDDKKDDETNTLRRVPLGVMYKFENSPYIVIINNNLTMDDTLYEIVRQCFIGSCHAIDDEFEILQSESEIENAGPDDMVFIDKAIPDTTSP